MAPPPKSDEQRALDKALGAVLRARRQELGLSVVDVADAANEISGDHLYRLEQGRSSAQPDTLRAIAKALKTTPDALRARAAELVAVPNGRRNGKRNGNGGARK